MTNIPDRIKKYGFDSNTVYSFMAKGAAMVFFFATDIALARLLPIEVYGEWSFFFSIMSMCFLFCIMGINASTRVYSAIEVEKGESLLTCIKSSLKLRLLASAAFSVAFISIAPLLMRFYSNYDEYPNLKRLFWFGAFLIFLNSVNEYLKDLWIGIRRQKYLFIHTSIEYAGLFIFGVALVWLFRSSVYIGVSYIASWCVSLFAGFMILVFYLRRYKIADTVEQSPGYWKKILRYAMPIWLISFGTMIQLEIGTVMLGFFHKADDVAIFNVAKKITDKAVHLNIAYIYSVMPVFAVITAENIKERFALFKRVCIVNIVLTSAACLVLVLGGSVLIPLLYGQQYSASMDVLLVLIPYYVCQAFILCFFSLLEYQRRIIERNIAFFVMIILNIALNFLFVPNYGATGAAISMSISIIPYMVTLIVVTSKLFKSHKTDLVKEPQP